MIGRRAELERVLAEVDRVVSLRHTHNVLFVTGEAGIGKTTLIKAAEEALAKKTGPNAPLVVATQCSTPLLGQDVGQVEALEPWAELLEAILEHDGEPAKQNEMAKLVGNVARAWVGCIPVVGAVLDSSLETASLVKQHMDPGAEKKSYAASQEQMFQQYINFLAKASEAHPLVLILDDFHWADTSSTNLLFSAARHLAKKRVLFVIAYRADDAASSRGGHGHPLLHVRNELGRYSLYADVVVPKMTAKDLDALLHDRYSSYHENDKFEHWLAERSGGNALFITQYLATLEEDGIVSPQTGEFKARFDSVRVPTSAFSVVEERIRRLDDDARELLRYASVEGATFTVMVLSETAEVPPLKLLQRLRLIAEKHGVIKSLGKQRLYARESTAYQFTNVLLQHALYESLEDEERETLHASVFRVLEADLESVGDAATNIAGIAVRLAAHAASAQERHSAARRLLQAAQASWARFAEEETLGVIAALDEDLTQLARMRGQPGAPDPRDIDELAADARMLSGLVHKFRGRHDGALENFRVARELFEAIGDEHRALKASMREAFTLENAKRYDEALTTSRAVLARAEELGDLRVSSAMTNNLGLVNTALGDHDKAISRQRESLEVREKIGDVVGRAVSLGSMGLALFSAGRLEEALAFHERALKLREETDDRVGQGYSLANIGNVLSALGRHEEALAFDRRSVEVREAIGDVVGQATSLENEAKVLETLGRADEAADRADRALRIRDSLAPRAPRVPLPIDAGASSDTATANGAPITEASTDEPSRDDHGASNGDGVANHGSAALPVEVRGLLWIEEKVRAGVSSVGR